MPSARRGKTPKKTKKVRARSSKSTRVRKKARRVSGPRRKSASKASARPKVKSRKSVATRQAKRAVPRKRVTTSPKHKGESHPIDSTYYMTVEEIETTSAENPLQADLWEPEIHKP